MDAAQNYGAGTVEFPLKWSHLTKVFGKGGFFPSTSDMKRLGMPMVVADQHSVILKKPLSPSDITLLRDWLSEYAESQHSIFGQFKWIQYNYHCVQECEGIRFFFTDMNIAVLFKLAWGDFQE